MAAKQTLSEQHLLLEQRWPGDCCLCHHQAENERLRKLLELIRYLAAERLDDGHGYTMMLTTIIIDIDAALRGEKK